MSLVRAYPIGVISMMDNGKRDEKVIAIPFNDPTYNRYTDIGELPSHIFEEMRHFFSVYKNLEHKETVVDEVSHRSEAVKVINQAIEYYNETFTK